MNIFRKKFIMFTTLVFLFSMFFLNLVEFMSFPSQINIFEGEGHSLDVNYPFKLLADKENPIIDIININDDNGKEKDMKIIPLQRGKTSLDIKLLGFFSIKKLQVDVLPKIKVIPGGHSLGVKLNTKGVLVVGLEEIKNMKDETCNPAREAGLQIGDSIIEIEGEKIKDADHVIEIINSLKGKDLNIKVIRNETSMKFKVKPVRSKIYKDYKIGLWVKDKTAGVGTLTFYDPNTMIYGALGHAISDIETGKILSVGDGEILESRVVSIKQGKKGSAGEIRGIFLETNEPLGKLTKNTDYGIYGEMYKKIENSIYKKPIEIALQHEVQVGKAKILTTVDDNEIKAYDIEIEKINRQKSIDNKSMIIKITDKDLLSKTGGIVQGMSGSPIIQNGKIVGAVTHVFVNDPTKGYGIFIEWMLNQSEITNYSDENFAKTG